MNPKQTTQVSAEKPLQLRDFPHLVELEKQCKDINFGTTLYWKLRATYFEKSIDPTYSDFERSNCEYFHSLLVNKQQ